MTRDTLAKAKRKSELNENSSNLLQTTRTRATVLSRATTTFRPRQPAMSLKLFQYYTLSGACPLAVNKTVPAASYPICMASKVPSGMLCTGGQRVSTRQYIVLAPNIN